jgi:pimeloyl-ACP methyl ester carboxylesterase
VVRREESGAVVRKVLESPRNAPKQRTGAKKTDVIKVLLVHGIRDYGERFDQIRDAAKKLAMDRGQLLLASAPTYGYFSALQFINPISRQYKVYEFADLYMEMLATPPIDAPIHFVGHSFGTYLMAESAVTYSSVKFERAYLAGSVLSRDYLARHGVLGDCIQYVRNDLATSDWPVGILCSGISALGLAQDIGTGGFNGFTGVTNEDRYHEVKYFNGGHGKALELVNRPTIAAWLLDGPETSYDTAQVEEILTQDKVLVEDRSYLWGLASRAAPALFIAALMLIAYLLLLGRRPCLALSEILIVMWLLNII